jgi:hypothetical protein
MHTQTIEETRKKILSIVEKLEPLELNILKSYAEYLAQRNSEAKLIDALRSAKSEDETLSETELKGIKQAEKDIKSGRIRDFKDYAKDRGLLS